MPSQSSLRALVIDDEANIRKTLTMCLEAGGHGVRSASGVSHALAEAGNYAFDLILLDLRLGTDNGMDLIPQLLLRNPTGKIVIITAYASIDTAVEAIKLGATDYLPKPFTPAQVNLIVQKVCDTRALERRVQALQGELGAAHLEVELTTTCAAMQSAVETARQVAKSTAAVLIAGEPGSGKQLLARSIHNWSERSAKALEIFNCSGKTTERLEAELFGLATESPTAQSVGKLYSADGGTLILTDIHTAPMPAQHKIMRLAQTKQYERGGEFQPRVADLRIIATTSANLDRAVEEGRFLHELLYTLRVIQIDVPPLRHRTDDIALLAERFLALFGRQYRKNVMGFSAQALALLTNYHWPGNVRELRNLVERSVMICHGATIGVEHFPPNLVELSPQVKVGDLVALDKIEESHIRTVINASASLESAADILGIDAATLWRRRKRYGI